LEEEMSAEKIEMAKNKELKEKLLAKKALLPKKMSRFNFEAPELDFNLPKDIKGSVRKLKTEGSILVDRFKSMQKRNVIETRVRQKYDLNLKLNVFTNLIFRPGSRGNSDPSGSSRLLTRSPLPNLLLVELKIFLRLIRGDLLDVE